MFGERHCTVRLGVYGRSSGSDLTVAGDGTGCEPDWRDAFVFSTYYLEKLAGLHFWPYLGHFAGRLSNKQAVRMRPVRGIVVVESR